MKEASYKRYLLALLLVILAFNYVDRLALGLMLQSIRAELALTDTQLGLLGGLAFAAFYSVMGIPIARWADRGNRVAIIAITTALWSVAVAASGLAASFLILLLIRVGVAVGEAGCIPPALSLIADQFNRAERPRAVARYMLGWPLSLIVGYFVAGWLNDAYGWRVTFMLLGLPGLILAPLTWLTLREPRRRVHPIGFAPAIAPASEGAPAQTSQNRSQPTLKDALRHLWVRKTFRHLLFAFSIAYFFGYGILQWQPAFFIRSFGLETGSLGTWLALIGGGGGLLGIYLGGELAARRAAGNERLQLKATAVAYGGFALLSFLLYLSPNVHVAFALLALATIGLNASNGPLFATIQSAVPEHLRASATAVIFLFANLIGMGLGPLAAGALSDALAPYFAHESLRYALVILSPGYLWGAWHLWQASRTVTRDVDVTRLAGESVP
jgi:MFS transporter, Spinster family, sphingosine-1-phosphate transporter